MQYIMESTSSMIKISNTCMVPVNDIICVELYKGRAAVRKVRERKQENLLCDVTCGRAINSIVYTRSGRVYVTNLTPDTIAKRIRRAAFEDKLLNAKAQQEVQKMVEEGTWDL